MEPSNLEEAPLLEDLFERNYERMTTGSKKKQIVVVLTSNSDPFVNVCVDNKVQILNKSNHPPHFQMKLSSIDLFKLEKPLIENGDFSIFSCTKHDCLCIQHMLLQQC